jgi:hypothetical protein
LEPERASAFGESPFPKEPCEHTCENQRALTGHRASLCPLWRRCYGDDLRDVSLSKNILAFCACRPAPLSCRTRLRDARLRRKSEVFRDAVRQQATDIVAVHNHPSGDPTPSAADVALTVEIVAAGQLLDIELLDHLIIGQGRWLSLKRLGLGFAKA